MDILFPHEKIRREQDKLISDVLNCVKTKKNMIIHAPTGIGKTAAVLSATLKYAIDSKKTIFFVTSKHTQHRIAIETLRKIKEKHNININVADLIGKRWMCMVPNAAEMPASEFYDFCNENIDNDTCEFYNNLKDKNKPSANASFVLNLLKENITEVDEVIKVCREKKLCAHEITMMHAQNCDVIIADYFHILSTPIRENLLKKAKKSINDAIIIIDEGHNLADRCRDLLSCQISNYILEQAKKEINIIGNHELAEIINEISNLLTLMGGKIRIDETERLVTKDELHNAINEIADYNEIISDIKKIGEAVLEDKKRSYANSLAVFLENWSGPDEGFSRILKRVFYKKDKINMVLNYRCLDPSIVLKPIASESNIIVMSGTLSPTHIYKNLFGFEAELKEYADPFPQDNRLNLVVPNVTTKFTERDDEMYSKIGEITAEITNSVPGNSIIFFPSYRLMERIYDDFNKKCNKTIFTEKQNTSKNEKEDIINKFKAYKDSGAVLLACASGSFGESIDLPGDYLKAVLIVGLPLPKQDLEIKEMIKYYDKKFNNGWDYGYVFPALITCIQNAGRCIRSETDKGVIVFLDQRYCLERYKKFFPNNWHVNITKDPVQMTKEFFDNKE